MSLQSSNQDSSLEDEKQRRKTDHFSSNLSNHSGTMQVKKNLAMTSSSRDKYTVRASGKLVRTPSTGSIHPEHKTKDYSSGKPDPCHICLQLCAERLHLQSDFSG